MRCHWLLLICLLNTPAVADDLASTQHLIASKGLSAYIIETIEGSEALRTILPNSERYKILKHLAPLKSESPINISSSTVKACNVLHTEIVHVTFTNESLMLIWETTDGTREKTFNFGLMAFPFGLSALSREFNPIVPHRETEPSFVAPALHALKQTLANKNYAELLKYEKGLAAHSDTLPVYVALRVNDGDSQRHRAAGIGAALALVNPLSDVEYVYSKSLLPGVFYSLYRFKSTLGPAVFVIYYEEIEGAPLVVHMDYYVGNEVPRSFYYGCQTNDTSEQKSGHVRK